MFQHLMQTYFVVAAAIRLQRALTGFRRYGLGLLLCICAISGKTGTTAQAAVLSGELGADLQHLLRFYTAPRGPGESNHYIDLWDGNLLPGIVRSGGLTNNRALFINSHGKGVGTGRNKRYVFYPHQRAMGSSASAPLYSVQDLAVILGAAAEEIHNVIIAGCDTENAFNAAEVRRFFPHATNITHVVAGQPGYQPMYLQAIFSPSENIETLYEVPELTPAGKTKYRLTSEPAAKAVKLQPYVAELFRPGARQPYRTTVAGRELLQSGHALSIAEVNANNPRSSRNSSGL